jgi:Ca2+-binding EF-hand superfamily protein
MSLSNSCQKKICQYFTSVNQNEKQQETAKQVFCNNTYFQIETCFNRIDKFKKGYLIPSDFTEFMLENKVICNEEEVYLVFKDFDRKRNGRVTLEDFT